MVKICILGAGIIGLSTAKVILDTQPNTEVVIIAEHYPPNTTSNVAAGIYKPSIEFSRSSDELAKTWLTDSLVYIKDMIKNHPNEAKEAGIIELSGYTFATEREDIAHNDFLAKALDGYRQCTKSELNLYPGEYKYGTFMNTYLIDNSYYLPYLMNKIQCLGGVFIKKTIKNFNELSSDFDVICNCTGLGSKYLCKDTKLHPIRGQVYKVKAPWIKEFVYVDSETYIIPGVDYVTLGTTCQFDNWITRIEKHNSTGIWSRCVKVFPSLEKAEIIKQCVGWRPYRTDVRIEKEIMNFQNGRSIKIVHNYGHGGYGVMSAQGCAIHAARLVREFTSVSSKL